MLALIENSSENTVKLNVKWLHYSEGKITVNQGNMYHLISGESIISHIEPDEINRLVFVQGIRISVSDSKNELVGVF